jgi:hypothetical protein
MTFITPTESDMQKLESVVLEVKILPETKDLTLQTS